MAGDFFADIAAQKPKFVREELKEQLPPKLDIRECFLQDAADGLPLEVQPKMSSKEELETELSALKKQYKPYLSNHAPKIKAIKERKYLTDFIVDGKERVTLPHYGGPTGAAVKKYETDFFIENFNAEKIYHIYFLGVDYRACVYINGICAGTHEGFFSPFKFEITKYITAGKNKLTVVVENDYIYMGNENREGVRLSGDKLYAATGLGWDDPIEGWHHCPPGMGIYNDVYIEESNRVLISDIFVKPEVSRGGTQLWVEVESFDYFPKDFHFEVSIYGHNFKATVFRHEVYQPVNLAGKKLSLKKGVNQFKIDVDIPDAKLWDLDTPYLYEVQISVHTNEQIADTESSLFGMREFYQDMDASQKGMFYLNGRPIRLRGANTMGFEQQSVLKKDFEQLTDDILYAKICNMNFLRLTQRPVQAEVYEYCSKLGLMTQTDLPLFACMRRTKFCEGVRQAEEMERLVRKYPCNVLVSLINEPSPAAFGEPHRNMVREELESFFKACDIVIKYNNPDEVIKFVDGDYDPPCDYMPDNHCYTMWYNGHGIEFGKLHKGYWMPIKEGWYYGCGEFGAEGLDFEQTMLNDYPKEWIKQPFLPDNILKSQTGKFFHFFYEKQKDMQQWIAKSQSHQAYATKIMTEAFRRNNNMVTFAIHLFIDAWPSGWMKTIMDCHRNPKPAFFAYRDALSPVMVSLRTDRFTYYENQTVSIECHISNDTMLKSKDFRIFFELFNQSGKLIKSSAASAQIQPYLSQYNTNAVFSAPAVNDRDKFILRAVLTDSDNKVVDYNEQTIEVFEERPLIENPDVVWIEGLTPGQHTIAGEQIEVSPCGMGALYYVSVEEKHAAGKTFSQNDFKNWYDSKLDRLAPIIKNTFLAKGFTPILLTGNKDKGGMWAGGWHEEYALAEKYFQGKKYVISMLDLRMENPVARRLVNFINS